MRDSYTFLGAAPPAVAEQPTTKPADLGWGAPKAGPGPQAAPHQPARLSAPSRGSRPPIPLAVLRLTDTAAPLLSLLAALVLTNLGGMPGGIDSFLSVRVSVKNVALVLSLLVLWRVACGLWGLYDWSRIRGRRSETIRVLGVCATVAPFTFAFPATSVSGAFDLLTLGVFWTGTAFGVLGPRALFRLVARSRRRPERSVLIVGSGPRALDVEHRLQSDGDTSYQIVGFIDSSSEPISGQLDGRLLATLDELESTLMRHPIDEVVIALPLKSHYAAVERVVRSCEAVGVRVTLPADSIRASRASFRASPSASLLAITLSDSPEGFRLVVKRWIDVAGATVVLALCWPVLLLVAITVKLTSKGPVFFVQERYGFNRRRFGMYKFRTMVADAEALQGSLESLNEAPGPLFKIRADPRVTRLGAFLRRTSLDELPQLFNVLRGEMSLVGPRPMAVRDVERFTEATLARRFSVMPGLTGLWQVSGRSSLSAAEWANLDIRYIDEWCLLADLRILLRTVPAVIRGVGAE